MSGRLLIVDADTPARRILELSLGRAGFRVTTATSVEAALQIAQNEHPDVVITEASLPEGNGFLVCQALRRNPATALSAVIFLTQDDRPETKIHAITVGCDDFLAKPALITEIVMRVRALLQRRATSVVIRDPRFSTLSGTLSDLGLVDLLQTIERGRKSGIVQLASDRAQSGGYVEAKDARGAIYFRDGATIDATLGRLRGAKAISRMLLWENGVFEVNFQRITRPDFIEFPTQSLILGGLERAAEWARAGRRISFLARMSVDESALSRAYPIPRPKISPVVGLFDGRRSVLAVIDESPLDEIETLSIVVELKEKGALVDAPLGGDRRGTPRPGATPFSRQPTPDQLAETPLPTAPPPSMPKNDPSYSVTQDTTPSGTEAELETELSAPAPSRASAAVPPSRAPGQAQNPPGAPSRRVSADAEDLRVELAEAMTEDVVPLVQRRQPRANAEPIPLVPRPIPASKTRAPMTPVGGGREPGGTVNSDDTDD